MAEMFEPRPSTPKKQRRFLAQSRTITSSPTNAAEFLSIPVHSLPSLLQCTSALTSPEVSPVKKTATVLAQMSQHPAFELEAAKPQLVVSHGENPGIVVRPGYQTIVPHAEVPDPFGRTSTAIEFRPELHGASAQMSAADCKFFGVEPMSVAAFWKIALKEGRNREKSEFLTEAAKKKSPFPYEDYPRTNGVFFKPVRRQPYAGFVLTEEEAFPLLCALYENALCENTAYLELVARVDAGEKLVIADGSITDTDPRTYETQEFVRGFVGSPDSRTIGDAFGVRDGKFGIGNALLARNTSMAFILYILLLQRHTPEQYPWRLATFTHWLPFDVPRSVHATKKRKQIELNF
jgi:hypothetical protein